MALRGTRRHAELAAVAAFRVEDDFRCHRVRVKGLGRAEGDTGPAVNALVHILGYAFCKGFHTEPLFFHEPHPGVEILLCAAQLQDHDAFTAGKDPCLEDIEIQIVCLGELARDRLIDDVGAVADDDFLGYRFGHSLIPASFDKPK